MKKLLFLPVLVVFFLGCKKNNQNDPFVSQFQSLLTKYLICDSIRTTNNNFSFVQPLGKGRGEDMMFNRDATFTKFSSPAINQVFQLQSPNKIYYYNIDDEVDENVFFTVDEITDAKLLIRKTDSIGKFTIRYLRVE